MFWKRKSKDTETPTPLISPPTTKTDYPSGLCVETEKGVFYIKGSYRYRVVDRVLDSQYFEVLPSTEAAVSHYPVMGKLGFRAGTLIENVADGKIYLISENKRRHIQSPDVFERLCLDRWSALLVSDEEANLHKDGGVLI